MTSFTFRVRALSVGVMLFTTVRSEAMKPCATFYREMADSANTELLSLQNLQKIDEIFRDPSLNSQEAAQKAFEIYFEARLKDLSPEVQKQMRNLLAKKVRQNNSSLTASSYDTVRRVITISGPEKYREGVMGFFELSHELEHAIVDHIHIQRYGKSSGITWWHPKRKMLKYDDELAAMRAEWNFIRSVPEDARASLISALEKDPAIDAGQKKFWIRSLKNASLDRDAYLNAEHLAGRYTRTQLAIEDFMMKTLGTSFVSAISFMIGVTGSTVYCIQKVRDEKFDRNVKWFQSICQPNVFVQIEIEKVKSEKSKTKNL